MYLQATKTSHPQRRIMKFTSHIVRMLGKWKG